MQTEQPKYRIGMTISACLWLGLFPLLQGGTYAHITYDKWFIMLILTGVTLLCFVADLILSLLRRRRPGGESALPESRGLSRLSRFLPLLLAGLLFLWTVLSCLLSTFGPDVWWIGSGARYEGLLSEICYFILFCCFFISRVKTRPVLLSAAAGVTVFAVIVLLQRAGGNPLGLYPTGRSYQKNPEFQGTIGNVDMGTGYLVLLAALFLWGLIHELSAILTGLKSRSGDSPAKRGTSLAAAAVLLLALSLTLYLIITMDVQFGAISVAALLLFTVLRFLPKKARLPFLALVLIAVFLVVWFWPGTGGGIWELHEILHGRPRLSFGSDRLAVWVFSLGLAREKLLTGGGTATFPAFFNFYLADNGLVIPKEQDGKALPDFFDNPHNEYVQQLTDHGLPALLLFLALLLLGIFRSSLPYRAAVFCYAVQAFFSFSVCIVAPMFWVVLGLAFSRGPEGGASYG